MKQFTSFSKIGHFKNMVGQIKKEAKWNNAPIPTIKFHFTPKAHGTNAGISFDKDGSYIIQSRKNVINVLKDNAGFAVFVEANINSFKKINTQLRIENPNLKDETIIFFGEWAGKGIQKGVSITELEKFYMMFAVKIKETIIKDEVINEAYYLKREQWEHLNDDSNRIYNVNDFDSWDMEIDFNNPKMKVNNMTTIVEQVEKECPIGNRFGVKGIGEGIVAVGWWNNNRYAFKCKGKLHSNTKVKTLIPVDLELVKTVNKFVEYALTENRLNQGIEQVFTSTSTEVDIKHTGSFIKWIVNDILDEELDTLIENNLGKSDILKRLAEKARNWYFKYIEDSI